MTKRKYRNNLDFIEEGFIACWKNCCDLTGAAKLLFDNDLFGQALSLSVLSLEELGKLFCLDGLLFARSDYEKAKIYSKSMKSHSVKLSTITLVPLLLGNIAQQDDRYSSDEAFLKALIYSFNDLKKRGNDVLGLMEQSSFQDLDSWKQQGFYACIKNNKFNFPNQAITKQISETILMFAWRASTILDFLLKGGSVKSYIDNARSIRNKMTETLHAEIEKQAHKRYQDLFPDFDDE